MEYSILENEHSIGQIWEGNTLYIGTLGDGFIYAGDIITILRCFKIDFLLVVRQNKYKCIRIVNKQIFNVLFDNDFVNKDKKSDYKINMSRL